MSATMTPRIRAEYDAEIATMKAAEVVVPKPPAPPPRTRPVRQRSVSVPSLARILASEELAAKLLEMCAVESTVDREAHALGVARMILRLPG